MVRLPGRNALWGTILVFSLFLALQAGAREESSGSPAEENASGAKGPRLTRAVMCEDIQDLKPSNPAVVFSVSARQVFCYTAFDPVSEVGSIFHRWVHRDRATTQIQLKLYPPRWSTYSSIQLRDNDKGPWRVEIVDEKGEIFRTLRFSIVD